MKICDGCGEVIEDCHCHVNEQDDEEELNDWEDEDFD